MTHRLFTSLRPVAFAALAVACLAIASTGASGSTLVKYRLANEGDTPISRLDFRIDPPGAVIAPSVGTDPITGAPLAGSPLTVLPSSTGFDTSKFSVALGSGSNVQGLRLLFGQTQTTDASGQVTNTPIVDTDGHPLGLFEPGAVLNFALNIDPASTDSLELLLPEAARGLSLRQYAIEDNWSQPTDSGTGTDTPAPIPTDPAPTTNGGAAVPEPASFALWGGLGLAGLLGLHHRRRRARHSAA